MKPHLGYRVLVVMERDPASPGLIQAVVNHGSDLTKRHFTLLCCCPAMYWEHGGGASTAGAIQVAQELAQVDAHYERATEIANEVLTTAANMLREAGVREDHITTRTCFEADSLIEAIYRELRAQIYSTVVIDQRQRKAIRRLTKRGIWKWFLPYIPEVDVWAVDVEELEVQAVL